LNYANQLTLSRLILAIIFLVFILSEGLAAKIIASVAFTLASLTDYLDGYIAKRNNLVTDFGKIMDPIADKFLMLSAFYVFSHMGMFPVWIFWVITAREVFITLIRLVAVKRGKVLAAETMGKCKTASQIVVIFTMLFYVLLAETPLVNSWPDFLWSAWGSLIMILMFAVAAITVYSGITFLIHNKDFYRV